MRHLAVSFLLLTACAASESGGDPCEVGSCGGDAGVAGPDATPAGWPDASSASQADAGLPTGGEQCDGLDDDGDGTVDEGCSCSLGGEQDCYRGDPALAGVGACSWGSQRCEGAGEFSSWGACTGDVGPTAERCDGVVDDDCDGVVDNGCTCVDGATRPCGSDTGECVQGGQTCVGGVWGDCVGGRGPTAEQCNRLDDDCDGVADDGCAVCREVSYDWSYADGCTLTTRDEVAVAPADFWPGQPLYARLMSSYVDDCAVVGNLSLPVGGCAQGKDSNIPTPTDIATLTPDQRGVPVSLTNLACYAYEARLTIRWCVDYTP